MKSSIELYKMNGRVPQIYKTKVKGNENATLPLIRRKLTRNIMLATKVNSSFEGLDLYSYGNLDILVNPEKHRIVSIKNHKGVLADWFVKDMDKYHELNEKLGIVELENKSNIM